MVHIYVGLLLAYELKKYKDAAINLGASIVFGLLAASLGMSLA